jgi:Carboxypeptidase regulatory-like domain
LIIGTVFNENALSFPGVQVRVRRSGEKKFILEAYTNSRGEFAVRVPPGYEYEVVTHVKKYDDTTENVDSKVDVQQRLSIKLEPRGQTKAGAKQ